MVVVAVPCSVCRLFFLHPAFLTFQVTAFNVLSSVYIVSISVSMWSVVRVPGVLLVLKLSLVIDKLENTLIDTWLG